MLETTTFNIKAPQTIETIVNISDLRDIEQGILNYMLLSSDNFLKIKNKLAQDDFTFMIHKSIFVYLCNLEDILLKRGFSNDMNSFLKVLAKSLDDYQNVKMSSTLDILSQAPSMHIDRDLEIINTFSMEKEIAIHNPKIQQDGSIETKDSLTWFNFINHRLISVGTTNIANLPIELCDGFIDTINKIFKLDLKNNDNELMVSFGENIHSTDDIESFDLKKDMQYLKWFDNICQWADKYNLDEDIFPRNRYKLQDLGELDISNKGINELPKEIGKLTNLKILNVDENNLKEFPKELYQLKNLIMFSFLNNDISYISEDIENFRGLLHFGACYNRITTIPKSFFKLKNLISICFHGNKLTSFPDDIRHLSKLASITISNNDINELPASITELQNLNSLDIENTKITSIPIKQLKLTRLCINDDLLPFIAKNKHYLNVDTINLTASHFQNDSKIVKRLNLKVDTKDWVEEQNKTDNGCVQLTKSDDKI